MRDQGQLGRAVAGPWLEVLASLVEHRVLTAAQVRAMHLPSNRLRWAQRLLARLREEELAADAPGPGARRVWFVTERGGRAVREAGILDREPRLIDARAAAGPLQAHTLAVNEVGISFMAAARERGDEFGPLSWRHEVAHALSAGRGRRRRRLIADALLTYLREDGDDVLIEQRFVEVDRATLSVDRLAAELGGYARLYRARDRSAQPTWRAYYPSFPPVLCVLEGAAPRLLQRRRDSAAALLRADPELSRSPRVAIRFCLGAELAKRGPFAPIFIDAREPRRPIDWLGDPASERGS